MNRIVGVIILLLYSMVSFSKTPLTVCSTSVGQSYPMGDGSPSNPYVVCNVAQFNRIAQEGLLANHFKLGSDIDFEESAITPIGTATSPYTGHFNGDGYTLKHISIQVGGTHTAIFSALGAGAILHDLNIDSISNTGSGTRSIAALVGEANNAIIDKINLHNAMVIGPDSSGLLIGRMTESSVSNCSVDGTLLNTFGADGTGGLVGFAKDSSIDKIKVNISIRPYNQEIFGISALGGLAGYVTNTQINDVYVIGSIDYSKAGSRSGPQQVGGIVGDLLNNSSLKHAFVVMPIVINAKRDLGAAVGRTFNINPAESEAVVWNNDISVVNESAFGVAATSASMGVVSYWQVLGFDESIWTLSTGQYPDLK